MLHHSPASKPRWMMGEAWSIGLIQITSCTPDSSNAPTNGPSFPMLSIKVLIAFCEKHFPWLGREEGGRCGSTALSEESPGPHTPSANMFDCRTEIHEDAKVAMVDVFGFKPLPTQKLIGHRDHVHNLGPLRDVPGSGPVDSAIRVTPSCGAPIHRHTHTHPRSGWQAHIQTHSSMLS